MKRKNSLPEGSILYLTLQFSSSRLEGGSTSSIFWRASVRNLLYLYGASERAFWVKMKDPATNWPSWHCPAGRRNVQHISRADNFTWDILPSLCRMRAHFFFFIIWPGQGSRGGAGWWVMTNQPVECYCGSCSDVTLHTPSGYSWQVETSSLCSGLGISGWQGLHCSTVSASQLRSVCW